MRSYWVSSKTMTVLVDADDHGVITVGPPIVHRFIGQPVGNLISWMRRQGGLIVKAGNRD